MCLHPELRFSALPLMFHSVSCKGWVLLLRNQPGSFTWILKASCILEFEGENKREGHCQSPRDTEELFRKQIISCCLYWGIKVKTITGRHYFVILTYLFSLYGFISPQFYQRIGPMFTDSTEGSTKAETETHGNSLWLCVSKPRARPQGSWERL